jgi:hypothetical protein
MKTLKNNMQINDELKGLHDFFEIIPTKSSRRLTSILAIAKKGSMSSQYQLTDCISAGLPFSQRSGLRRLRNSTVNFYTLSDKKVTGRNMTCSMCNTLQDELWGYVSVYNFYTSKTELAPIAGGLRKERAHINYPVCPQCAAKLKRLQPIVDKYFGFSFCGLNYLLIPEVISDKVNDNPMKQIVDIMVSQYGADAGTTLILDARLGSLAW